MSASYSDQGKPANDVLSVWLCYDSANQLCVKVPSTTCTYGPTGSLNASSAFAPSRPLGQRCPVPLVDRS